MVKCAFVILLSFVFSEQMVADSIDLGVIEEGLPDSLDETFDEPAEDDFDDEKDEEDPFRSEEEEEEEKEEDVFSDDGEPDAFAPRDDTFEPAEDAFAPREDAFAPSADDFREEPPADDFDQKDSFREEPPPDSFRDDFETKADVDYTVDREKQMDEYREPMKGSVVSTIFFYRDKDVESPVMFELKKGDEVEVTQEDDTWYKIRFLGKEGWVKKEGVNIPEFYAYRIYLEINGGMGGQSGDVSNYKALGLVNGRVGVSIVQDLSLGLDYQGLFIDSDATVQGVGGFARWLVPYLRTRNSRLAVSAGGGYAYYLGRPGYTDDFDSYKIFSGGYFGASVDYIHRIFDWLYIGVGPDILYSSLKTTINNDPVKRDFLYGGGHMKIIVNILR
ncbi:MAG: SH3 domain-containing protein [bacterium]